MDIAEYADALVSGEPSLRKSLLVEASNKYGVAGIVSAVASKYWINSVEAVRALGPIAGLAQPKGLFIQLRSITRGYPSAVLNA